MNKSILKFSRFIFPLAIAASLGACNNEDDNIQEGESKVTLRGSAQQSQASSENKRVVFGAFSVTNFQVGSQDVDMSYAAKSDIGVGINIGDITLRSNTSAELGTSASQPKTNVLIANGEHQTSIIGEGTTPNGNYTEITFKLFQNTNAEAGSFAKDKSLYIVGDINGKPARMWLTAEETVRATAATSNGYEINGNTDLMVMFNLEKLFANMNMDLAIDGNADGIIDIGPDNVDGNGTLHSSMRSNLSSSVEFIK